MSIGPFEGNESPGYLRCDQPAVARRQLEMSIGLVVVLLIATLVAIVATPMMSTTTAPTAVAASDAAPQGGKIVHAQARVVPMYKMQASQQTRTGNGS